MATDQDSVSRILSALSHPLRREILAHISEQKESSFTDLMVALGIDTGKLSFHLRSLDNFLEQTSAGKYRLNNAGENAFKLIKDLETWAVEVDIARDNSVLPLANLRKRTLASLTDLTIALTLFIALPASFSSIALRGFSPDFNNVVLFFLLLWMYLTLLEGFAGQTLGKRLFGLRVIRTDGKKLSYDHAAVRNFGKVFLLPVDLLIGLRLKDKRFIKYFDKFSGTTVVNLRN
ncbi:MAG: RDD family protein [Candidatus Bathyarchaeia archaeon]|jgi:uncharacterized RDD family membrane protein YckC/DNA-binding transcriptional ArsR family regulator